MTAPPAEMGEWKRHVADKLERRKASIPKEWLIPAIPDNQTDVSAVPYTCGLLTEKEIEITDVPDVSILLQKLASGVWSAVEVTTAFSKRAIIAQQAVNCLTEIFIDKALERAAELDAFLKEHGTVMGPLHGLPISLKDQICIKGLETTMGYAAWIGKVAEDDAVLVKLLVKAGAVLFVRTNVPQTLMWGETANNVFGRTHHPLHRRFTPGGSSGGEGALIAMHGSVLGVGSDIGGSIRIPASFCGLYGFKPSSNRLPSYGIVNSLDGQESVPSSLGPLSISLSGVSTLVRTIIEAEPWRYCPNTVPKPWSQDEFELKGLGGGKKLCFGIMWDEGSMKPVPPIQRALEMTKKALESAGHTVIDWQSLRHAEYVTVARSAFLNDGNDDFNASIITGEPLIQSMNPDEDPSYVAPWRVPRPKATAYEIWQLNKERRALRKALLDRWEATSAQTGTGRPIDALISPAGPYTAVPHGHVRSSVYTIIWNTMDYPSLVFPVTKVDPALDAKPIREDFWSEDDKFVYDTYDAEKFNGLPACLQVVGPNLHEEQVLGIGAVVEAALKGI
ncbi:general amidase [Epithele typhae]|uniref:general amidase n=1 Tax=Epithele typhae TaxID=378194 RepID=UPI00200827D8|nr:general amidase [Epithele typhae]KAH9944410.1 general amidase [Epithele typhae]